MEITDILDDQDTVKSWSLESLRTVRYETTSSRVFAKSKSISQRIYRFQTDHNSELDIRRAIGLPYKNALSDLIWLKAFSSDNKDVRIAIDPAYIFERTGCLLTPGILAWGGQGIAPLLEIATAVVNEIQSVLDLQVEEFLDDTSIPSDVPNDYLAVDHKRTCKLILLSDRKTLDALEIQSRNYCISYWNDYESMGRKIAFELSIYIYPSKKKWTSAELADLQEGDLLSIQNFNTHSNAKSLRGSLRFKGERFTKKNYEVFIEMNDEDTKLHFGSDDLKDTSLAEEENNLAPHEQIELEIHAGKTKILFNELCSVQEGTLIELRQHALPMVTLCVMGSPILEGELVHFQDQLMVQVTKRLD
jgi:flagellar motor switch/type III secretory pathway protein FliN